MLLRRYLIAAFLFVACVGAMLTNHPAIGQEQPARSANTAATAEEASPPASSEVADSAVAGASDSADAAPLRIQLIKVRSDWSQGKEPEETQKALESLLESETLRDEVRENLLGSASQILFPEGYLAVYKPQELAASLAWMKERDLMQTVAESEPIANHERPDWARHYTSGCSARVFATEDMIPMTTLGTDDVPPFTKRTYGVEWFFLSWKVFEKDHTSTKEIAFRLTQAQQRVDRLQGDSGEVVSMDYYGGGGFDGTCPPDQVSVFHGFSNSPAIRQYTREKGWEPLLVIVPAGQKQLEVKTPKLARLISLQRIGKGNLLPPRTEPVEKEKEEEPKPEEPQIKIFQLAHARADQMVAILRQLFPEITMSGDERTNSLLAQGEEHRLEAAEAVIQKLDETPTPKQEPPLDEAARRRTVESASTDFASAEAQIQSIVKDLAGKPDKKTSEQLRARLAGLVGEAFDLRQKLQRAEVGLLRQKIKIVETRLQQRETLRKEIIDRRVEELLGDNGSTVASHRPTPAKTVAARSPEHAAENASPADKPTAPATPFSLSAVEKIRSQTRQERFAGWEKGYRIQSENNPWPRVLSPQFQRMIAVIDVATPIPPNYCIEYFSFLRGQVPGIRALVKSVMWDSSDYAELQSGFQTSYQATSQEVRLAQEDLWVYEAILRSIAAVNKDSEAGSRSPISSIEALRIGKRFTAAYRGTAKTDKPASKDLLERRYVDTTLTPLPVGECVLPEFKLLPVQLVVKADKKAVKELCEELARCAMPVTILRVGKTTAHGEDAEATEIVGLIRIYNPADVSKLVDAPVAVDFKNTPWPDVFQWLADTYQVEFPLPKALPEGTCTLGSKPLPRDRLIELINRTLQKQGFELHLRGEPLSEFSLQMTGGEYLRRNAVKTREAITKWKKALQEEAGSDEDVRAVVQERLGNAEHDMEELRTTVKSNMGSAAAEHKRLESAVASGRQRFESLQTLQAKGYVDPAELEALQRSLEYTQDTAASAHASLEAFRKAAEVTGLTPAEIEEAEAAPPAPPEQLTITPTFPLQFDQKPWKDVLQWFADARGYRLRIMDPIPEDQTFTYHSPEPVTLDEAFEILRTALSDLGYQFYEIRSLSGGKKSLSLRTTEAESMRRKVAELQSQVARWQEALADNTTPRSDEEVATLENRLKSAQAEVALLSKGFLQRIQFYSHSLSSAERQATAARQKWEELEKLQTTGDATEAEVAAAQEAFERSDKSFQFQKTQVDELRKAAAAVGLSDQDAQPAEESTTPPQEAPAKPPLPAIGPAAAPANPRPTLPLRSPEEFQRLASEARQSIERLEIRVGTKDDYEGLQNDLRSARERLTLIRAEFATQLRALESEVRKAELEYSVAESEWRTVDEAVQRVPDSYSKNDVNNYRATSEVAKARLEQTKALLELYRKAGETADLKAAGAANASPDAAPRPHAAVTAPLAGVETTTFRTPEQFQKTLHEARRQTAYIQKTIDELPARREELGKRYESELANARQDLATARQHQELVEAEYAAQILLDLYTKVEKSVNKNADEQQAQP